MTQPAGWYADPSGLPARRWWDGAQWTDHVQPGGAPMPPPNGYFPPVPPSGPAAPGAHTVAPDNPEQTPLYAAQPAGFQHGGLPTVSESRPAAPPPHPEVPAAPYTMPPVDAVAAQLGFAPATPAPSPPAPAGWRRFAGPVALAVIAAIVLALVAFILLG
ncbi:hypothetical protein Aph02nite_13870 [Actinoplanes philippinensis]|uniref:DUF2510 domain-containing protein n=1 Tax=Actinoplanes philippinensis TaxID=35752 RepID=A0A1I1ZK26_9ACTN|nr:DUF2510 domain-containing protein [Actinoplanes philippinensis]GIE75437.1 hypothetical protein Aph02nite_13870 [Actinoplanes philippinensis]SFE32057.1 Protein of unknown function [Actinoplanes philippinensis]